MHRLALLAGWLVSAFAYPGQQPQTRATYQASLLRLRDTLIAVEAAASGFNRDLRAAAPQTVLVRAEYLRKRCDNGRAVVDSTRLDLRSAAALPRLRAQYTALNDALTALQRDLVRECLTPFRPNGPGSWADSLRAWGPYRETRISGAIRSYNRQAAVFAGAAGFKLQPRMPDR